MVLHTQYSTLLHYHFDLIRRLMAAAANLAESDYYANPGYSHGSVHELLFHLLATDLRWRSGLETGQRMPGVAKQDYPDLASVQALYEAEKAAWLAYIAGLSEADLAGDAVLTSTGGQVASIPRWRILLHLGLHGMQHSAELAELLTQKGQSPGNIDFIFYESQ